MPRGHSNRQILYHALGIRAGSQGIGCLYWVITETHKGLKRVTLIGLLSPMLVVIHFQKYHILEREEEMTDQSNFVNNVT